MKTRTVYVVKFNCGYYAKKQTVGTWEFTDNVDDANLYSTEKTAKERGELGVDTYSRLLFENTTNGFDFGNYVVECYIEQIELKRKN